MAEGFVIYFIRQMHSMDLILSLIFFLKFILLLFLIFTHRAGGPC